MAVSGRGLVGRGVAGLVGLVGRWIISRGLVVRGRGVGGRAVLRLIRIDCEKMRFLLNGVYAVKDVSKVGVFVGRPQPGKAQGRVGRVVGGQGKGRGDGTRSSRRGSGLGRHLS